MGWCGFCTKHYYFRFDKKKVQFAMYIHTKIEPHIDSSVRYLAFLLKNKPTS